MENTNAVWAAYIIAAVLTLTFKLLRYIKDSEKYGKTDGQSMREWFFEASLENAASWLGTVGVVWVCGYLYINQVVNLAGLFGKVVEGIPVNIPVAALLGYLAEMVAPAILKWITNKVNKALA